MIALPAISALIAFGCVVAITRDAIRNPKPDRIAWILAFSMFAIAAGAEVVGDLAGWSAPLVRIYYVTGAVLVVGYLALGQLYLVAPDRIRRVAPGVTMLLTAISVSAVLDAPIDSARLEADGWDALTRTTGLKIMAIGLNSAGTLVLIGGLVYSAIRFRQLGTMRNRMIGCLLIALGTLTVATGGTLTRLGSDQYLYIAMSAGIGMIFAGYLWTKKPDQRELRAPVATTQSSRRTAHTPAALLPGTSPGIAFVERLLATKSDVDLIEECRVWSVPVHAIDAFTRTEARRVWTFRNRLSPNAQQLFDACPVGLRLQLADLYFDVLTAEISSVERNPQAVELLTGRDALASVQTSRTVAGSVD